MSTTKKNLDIHSLSQELEKAYSKKKPSSAAKKLTLYSTSDIANFLDKIVFMPQYQKLLGFIFNIIPKEVLPLLQSNTINELIKVIGEREVTNKLLKLEIRNISKILNKINKDYQLQIIDVMKLMKKREVSEILSYVENTADKIMDKDYIALNFNIPTKEALATFRSSPRNVNTAIVIDDNYQPVGIVTLLQLYQASPITPVNIIMTPNKNTISADIHIQEIVYLTKKYSLDIIPVVNEENRLIGVISPKDILQIISEQTEKDIMSFEGLYYQDTFSNIFSTMQHRFPWLLINLIAAIITSLVINKFNEIIIQIIVLASVMPIIASMAGNSAAQVMTITIRALINKYISEKKSALRAICKEIMVSLLNGALLSIIGSVMLFALYKNNDLSITFTITVMINLLFGSIIGSSVPIILHNLDIDNASSSVVIVTALTDAFSFFSFLGIAYYIMA